MKYLITMFLLLSVAALDAQTVDDAIDWNDELVSVQSVLLSYEDALISVIGADMPNGFVDLAYDSYLNYINYAIKYYESVSSFDSQDIFRKAVLQLLYDFKKIATTDYAELIVLYKKPAGSLTDTDFERWENLITHLDDAENASNSKFLEAQEKFADQYGFTLED